MPTDKNMPDNTKYIGKKYEAKNEMKSDIEGGQREKFRLEIHIQFRTVLVLRIRVEIVVHFFRLGCLKTEKRSNVHLLSLKTLTGFVILDSNVI